ncbi:class III chitinase [Thelephora ganbajun]|uniref:Class III chitinase n=1 Tax=Thelephora ganbajun TaxID=370292 RepID=A0ACB6ZGN1_THEGA|nr:class III chitinase [Thelephora ganbajun]
MHFSGLSFVVLSVLAWGAVGFDNTRYWGQNSRGASNPTEPANYQKPISFYCQDDAIDVIPVAFLTKFFSTGGLPEINLANTCSNVDNGTFPGTSLANCQNLAADIKACQAKGKLVTLSLGGATGSVSFTGDDQAQAFADTIWNLFLGGSSSTRPFGSAVLDGIDLDIESGTSTGYPALVNRIRSLASGASKKYYVTAAPQCVYPDAALGGVLNSASFDAIYVQFYNNPCGLQNFNSASKWNFGIWDYWARNVSPNKDVKVYIGAPGSAGGAGGGYVSISTLSSIAVKMRQSYPSFGGVMLWDASQAYVNGRYDLGIKNALKAAGGTGFTYPTCSAPAYVSGQPYTAGQQVSYNGYIWQPKWWTNTVPNHNSNGDWSEISACQGSVTTTSTGQQPTGGQCSGVPAWTSTAVFTGGQMAVYNGRLYKAKWWTQGDIPGTSADGPWADSGACGGAKAKRERPRRNSRFFVAN